MHPTRPGITIRSNLKAGNVASDRCWSSRNYSSVYCAGLGWSQDSYSCYGNYNSVLLKECLADSGEKDWYKAFPSCTSDWQCFQDRAGGACANKCNDEHKARIKVTNEKGLGPSWQERGRCLRTCPE